MYNGKIIIKLPYPIKIGFISIFVKRKIGFSFNQRALFNLLQNNNIDLPNHSEWLKKTPKNMIMLETLFAGAQSYREELRLNDNFTKKGLFRALAELDEDEMGKIVKCWTDSEQFGFKKMPGKKKQAKR